MIKTKTELKEYIKSDNWYYYKHYQSKERLMFIFLRDPQYLLKKYKYFLRKEEYYLSNPSKINTIKRLFYLRRKNILGNKLGILIPPYTFGKGLMIMHHGSVIVNPNVRVGQYCVLHGNNCLGNDGKNNDAPKCGDNLDVGIGASIIGDVVLGNNIVVGANAVVTRSFNDNLVIVGIPADVLK